jgi:hypothetical protein
MAVSYGSGLTSVKIGAIAGDGGMGTALVALGNTVAGSMQLTSEEGTTTDFNIEEQDKPVKSIIQAGATRLTWECYDVGGETMAKLFGGTYDSGTDTYTSPDKVVAQELSLELTSAEGHVMSIVRASVFPTFNWSFSKDALAKISVSATILQPTKVGEKPFKIVYA